MARTKFVSAKIWDVVGFFNPHDDKAEFHGKLVEWKPPMDENTSGGFIVELTAACKNVIAQGGEVVTAKKGDRIGVNRFTALAGLEDSKYMGQTVHCKITGRKQFGDADREPAFMAEVEIGD